MRFSPIVAHRFTLVAVLAFILIALIAPSFSPAAESVPATPPPAPVFARIPVEGIELLAIRDGAASMKLDLVAGAQEGEVKAILAKAGLPEAPVPAAINVFAVKIQGKWVLIDAGLGEGKTPELGRMAATLKGAGIDPAAVSHVLLTHLDFDHAGGLLTPQGEKEFPKATIMASEAEVAGSIAEAGKPAPVRPAAEAVKKAIAAYRAAGHFRTFKPGGEVVPGITAIDLSGHTPGHTGYLIQGTGKVKVLAWGDTLHMAAIQFTAPWLNTKYDQDPSAAQVRRQKTLEWVAAEPILVAGVHIPFPGVGRVEKDGQGFRFLPAK